MVSGLVNPCNTRRRLLQRGNRRESHLRCRPESTEEESEGTPGEGSSPGSSYHSGSSIYSMKSSIKIWVSSVNPELDHPIRYPFLNPFSTG